MISRRLGYSPGRVTGVSERLFTWTEVNCEILEKNLKFFQKRKKSSKMKNSIIPKNIDLDHAAVIFNRKKSLGSSLVFEKNKTEEDKVAFPKKYGSSFKNPFPNDENYTQVDDVELGSTKKVENSKDFIKNFLKKKERKDEISKLSDYVTQVSTGKAKN